MKFIPKEILVTAENIIKFSDADRCYFRIMNRILNNESLILNIIDSENNSYSLILNLRKGFAKLINMKNRKIIYEQIIADSVEYVSGETRYILKPFKYISPHKIKYIS